MAATFTSAHSKTVVTFGIRSKCYPRVQVYMHPLCYICTQKYTRRRLFSYHRVPFTTNTENHNGFGCYFGQIVKVSHLFFVTV